MKVRILLHELYGRGGGVLIVSLRLAEKLAERGHDVELVCVRPPRSRSVHAIPDNVTVTSLVRPEPPGLRESRRTWLRRWLRRRLSRRPSRVVPALEPRYKQYSLYTDLVLARYLWSVRGGAVIAMQPGLILALARLGRRRYVRLAQEHRPFVDRPRGIIEAYRRYGGGLDTFLALNEEDATRYGEVIDARVLAMPNSTPHYGGELADQQAKVVTAAGRLRRSKGFDLLVAAWADVAARHPDWQLRIYGEGSARTELEAQIAQLGLQGTVRLMGFSNTLQRELAASSLFVLSSRTEGYGMVLVEAMACGVPVVSFDCPTGPRDIITHDVDGLLVPPEDVGALGQAINQMIELGPQGRRKCGVVARESALKRNDSEIVGRWERLLDDLVAEKSR